MTTFSQLVDSLVVETKRYDMRDTIADYVRQTIREMHIDPESNAIVHYWANYNEEQVTATSEQGFAWPLPNVATFQNILAVRFDNVWVDNQQVYAEMMTPGRRLNLVEFAFQRAGDRILFKGYGGINAKISLAWYEFPKALRYWESVTDRPASYDMVDGWTYAPDYDVSDLTRETARNLTTNWIIQRWEEVLKEGVRAKIYKRMGDDVRSRTCYSLFQSQRRGMLTSEIADIAGAR